MSKIAVCIPTRQDNNEPTTLGYPLISLALQSFQDFSVYIHDEGNRDIFADRNIRLILNLLAMKGSSVNYSRSLDRHGVAFARRKMLSLIKDEPYLLWLDDDMIIEPSAINALVTMIESNPCIGFVQGTKKELDPLRKYYQDINQLNSDTVPSNPIRIYFGDAAFLLMRTNVLRHIDWELITRYPVDGLPGEDVSMSLLTAQNHEGWGLPNAIGYHISPSMDRWRWEPSSDALQIELLRDKVDPEILRKAIPYLAPFIKETDGRTTSGDQHPSIE